MSNVKKPRSIHAPRVRDGLCRYIRSKGMIVNIGEKPENDSSRREFLAVDRNTMDWDGTSWWCQQSGKTVGPDDRPCHNSRCVSGRSCFEAEDQETPLT
jgi:hypothetical protein